MQLFLLFETAAGYALFEKEEFDDVGVELEQAQKAVTNFDKFAMLVKLKAYSPFKTAEEALENINAIITGDCTQSLVDFLQSYLPAVKEKKK